MSELITHEHTSVHSVLPEDFEYIIDEFVFTVLTRIFVKQLIAAVHLKTFS